MPNIGIGCGAAFDKDFKVGVDEAEEVIVGPASGQLDAKSLAPIIKEWLKK